jgi:SAM-dependent methyltransferase
VRLPLRFNGAITLDADGIPCDHLTKPFYESADPIRRMERASIRWWMESQREHLKGRVLDFGAGTQPYKDLVDGEYVPYEKDEAPIVGQAVDAIMCNQVIQYLEDPYGVLNWAFRSSLRVGGFLVMTYPVCWPEVEDTDLQRFTKAGMERELRRCSYTIVTHDLRAHVTVGGLSFPLGYGVICQK